MTSERLPSVSVIVPTYGRPESLRRCVAALLESEYEPDRFEIVVVDDGSPDPVELGAIGNGAPRVAVQLIRQENTGPAGARNRGAEEGSGEILAFTDDDCRPTPDWLPRLVTVLQRDTSALVGGRTINGIEDDLFAEASQELIDFLYSSFARTRELRPFFTSNNICAHRESFRAVGGFDDSFPRAAAEDRDLSERWVEHGPLVHAPEARVLHDHHLGLRTFLRQHHAYGRGAAHLARVREARGAPPPGPEPVSFYLRMLGYPYRSRGFIQATAIASLLFLSQAATLHGIVTERRSSADPSKSDRLPNARKGAR